MWTSRQMAAERGFAGVLPTGELQKPFDAIVSIISWQVIASLTSPRTLAAASRAESLVVPASSFGFAAGFTVRAFPGFVALISSAASVAGVFVLAEVFLPLCISLHFVL